MSVFSDSNSPEAEKLKSLVQQRALQIGWTEDSDDTSLSEYIILLIGNDKSQAEIANELSTELIPGADGIEEFTAWLMKTARSLDGSNVEEEVPQIQQGEDEAQIPAAYDTDLGENAPDNAYVKLANFGKRHAN